MDFLNLRIPPYVRIDLVQLSLYQFPKSKVALFFAWTKANLNLEFIIA